MNNSPDLAQLLARVALRDQAAFDQLYRATSAHLLGIAFRISNNRERAEELLQETFVNVWHNAGSYNAAIALPMTWLINITRNKAIDARRSGATERASTVALEAPSRASTGRGLLGWFGELLSARALGGALAGLLLATVVLRMQPGLIGLEPRLDNLPQSYVGLLLDGAGKPTLLASSRRHGRLLTIKMLQPINVPAGKVAQLWALPKDGGAPFAVATIPDKGSATVALPESSEKLFFTVTQLAVSFEAAPAKQGDKPSAEFVLRGHCVKLW